MHTYSTQIHDACIHIYTNSIHVHTKYYMNVSTYMPAAHTYIQVFIDHIHIHTCNAHLHTHTYTHAARTYTYIHKCSDEVGKLKRAYEAMQRDMEAAASQAGEANKYALSLMSCGGIRDFRNGISGRIGDPCVYVCVYACMYAYMCV